MIFSNPQRDLILNKLASRNFKLSFWNHWIINLSSSKLFVNIVCLICGEIICTGEDLRSQITQNWHSQIINRHGLEHLKQAKLLMFI